jgi:beta-galactosidase
VQTSTNWPASTHCMRQLFRALPKLPSAKLTCVALALCLAATSAFAKPLTVPAKPQTLLLNDDWQYLENITADVHEAQRADNWQQINLPHTWNATDTVDAEPGYRRNASWYSKDIKPAKDRQGLRHVLYFEGANMITNVYVNGEHAGSHVGGYVGFEVDISDYLRKGRDNALMIRVSNEYDPNLIPSQKSDFFIHGGLTRDLWLKVLPSVHLSRMQIDTPAVSAAEGVTEVSVEGLNSGNKTATYELVATFHGPDGQQVARARSELKVAPGAFSASLPVQTVHNPVLWSPAEPNLYSVEVALTDGERQVHQLESRYGYRWFHFEDHGAFFLNGERLLLRGTHRHEEHAGLGAAMPNQLHRQDMRMIKDLGANFVRLGHYPQDPEIYRSADELGLILWDELPWCRGGMGGAEWKSNTERLLREQITQNRNHPSIIFWSLGNEIYWEEDFPGGGDPEKINPYLQHLNDVAHELDSSRFTSIRKYYEGADIVDVFSPSIWAGWYGGSYSQYEEALLNAQKKYPRFLHMEFGGSSHVGRHTTNPISKTGIRGAQVDVEEAVNQAVVKSVAKDSNWNENYIVDLFDWHLQVSENLPNFAGSAQWAFKDFGTPLRPKNPIPYMNQKGLVDRQGRPKDAYYVYKSYWSDEPFCYIESHTWTHRGGAKDEAQEVNVFCNTESAELSLNGKSLGNKQRDPKQFPAGGLVWQVPFKEGKNSLSVTGAIDGKQVAEDAMDVEYIVGPENKLAKVQLRAYKLDNGNLLIEATALDSQGKRCIACEERVYFSNLGAGHLLENYGTPDKSSEIEMADGRAVIQYQPDPKKSSFIEVRSQDVKGVYLKVNAQGEVH